MASRRRWTEQRKSQGGARRLVICLIVAAVLVAGTAYLSARIFGTLKQASHYSMLDLRRLQFALYVYSLKSRLSGGPSYPPTLQALVEKGALSQSDLDRITRSYIIEYIPPAPDAPPDTIVFRAQRKPVATIYTVSGQSRNEASTQ